MSMHENKAILLRYYEKVCNQRNLAVADEIFGPNFKLFPDSQPPYGPEGVKNFITWLCITTFPDLHVTIEDMIAEGDTVAAHITLHGTQNVRIDWFNDIGVIPPSGRQFDAAEAQFWRIAGGKIVERWVLFDNYSWLQHLGAFTALQPANDQPCA